MNRRTWVIAVLGAWALSLGWLVKREVFRSTGARLAAAAMAVAPGGLFYRLEVGGQQVGYSSTTIDTLPHAIRVENVFVLDVPAQAIGAVNLPFRIIRSALPGDEIARSYVYVGNVEALLGGGPTIVSSVDCVAWGNPL